MIGSEFLIYGATGYTGGLIAARAVQRGMRPILAGRDLGKVRRRAEALRLPYRGIRLDDARALDRTLDEVPLVLHCAGPFLHTWRAMADACLRTRRHYLDITGEVGVFEALAARDRQAVDAEIMLLPGVGFDVVPSDCLAAHLKRRLPSATRLTLAFSTQGSRPSRGTARTVVESLRSAGLIRRDGVLTPVPMGWKRRHVDFGDGSVEVVSIPWGDISTAFHSTNIPNIEVYTAMPRGMIRALSAVGRIAPLLNNSAARQVLKGFIRLLPPGPSEEQNRTGTTRLWGEVGDERGERACSRLFGPESYAWSALTALAAVEKILQGNILPGFQTPSRAFGPDFVLETPGVRREDSD